MEKNKYEVRFDSNSQIGIRGLREIVYVTIRSKRLLASSATYELIRKRMNSETLIIQPISEGFYYISVEDEFGHILYKEESKYLGKKACNIEYGRFEMGGVSYLRIYSNLNLNRAGAEDIYLLYAGCIKVRLPEVRANLETAFVVNTSKSYEVCVSDEIKQLLVGGKIKRDDLIGKNLKVSIKQIRR